MCCHKLIFVSSYLHILEGTNVMALTSMRISIVVCTQWVQSYRPSVCIAADSKSEHYTWYDSCYEADLGAPYVTTQTRKTSLMLFWQNLRHAWSWTSPLVIHTVYPKKYGHDFVVLCFVVVIQSFIINSHEVFINIHRGCFAGTGAIVRLPQCQWSKPDGYGKISQCITKTKHSKAKTVCIFLGIYCMHKD